MGRKFYRTCEDLKRELGATEALEIINYLEPKLEERQQQLIQIIRIKNYAEIARYAHKTKGSIHYYGTHTLSNLLDKLINVEYNSELINDYFIDLINAEFNFILHYWRNCKNR